MVRERLCGSSDFRTLTLPSNTKPYKRKSEAVKFARFIKDKALPRQFPPNCTPAQRPEASNHPKTSAASARGADGGRVLHRTAPRDRDVMWELLSRLSLKRGRVVARQTGGSLFVA